MYTLLGQNSQTTQYILCTVLNGEDPRERGALILEHVVKPGQLEIAWQRTVVLPCVPACSA